VHASTRRGDAALGAGQLEDARHAVDAGARGVEENFRGLVAAARLNGRFQTVKGALRERERDATQLVENDVGAAELERAHEQLDKVF